MNYYFLVEDEKSLFSILPTWLKFMGFHTQRVAKIQDVTDNNYVLQSGQGVTQLETKILFDTIDTILAQPVIDKLIVIVDAEDIGVEERKNRIVNKIHTHYANTQIPFEIKVFVCNRCIETWLLGCKGIKSYHENSISTQLSQHYKFYDIENNDPEKMSKPATFESSIASYHFQYLHELLLGISRKEKQRSLKYTKKNPGCVLQQEYFDAVLKRSKLTEDIASFKDFYNFISSETKIHQNQ